MKTADRNQLGSRGRDPVGRSYRNVVAMDQECPETILAPRSSLWLLLNEYFFLEAICKRRTENQHTSLLVNSFGFSWWKWLISIP